MTKLIKIALATAAGFVAGILVAPKSGKETRQDIKDKAVEAKHVAAEKAEQVKAAIHDGTESLKEGSKHIGTEAAGLNASTRASADRLAAEAKILSGEAKKRALNVAEDARQTASKVQKDIKKNLK